MSERDSSGDERDRFITGIPAHLELLREARTGLQDEVGEADASLKRFSKFIGLEAARLGFQELARAATQMAGVNRAAIAGTLEDLEHEFELLLHDAGTANILVVEDEATTRELLATAAEGRDRLVHVAETAARAREVLSEHPIDLVVLDLILPDADGRHLLMELGREREGDPRVSVVVVTAKGTPTTRAECFAYGADTFIEKPLDPSALQKVLNGVLGRRRARHREDVPVHSDLPDRDELKGAFASLQAARRANGTNLVLALIDLDPSGVGWDTEGRKSSEFHGAQTNIVSAVRDTVGAGDYVGRWGVNELAILFSNRSSDACVRLLERARESVDSEGRPFVAGVTDVELEALFEDAVSWASRLIAEGRMSEGTGILHTTLATTRAPFALVVEDDPITASLVRHRLERSGFEVEHYDHGIRGLEAIRRAVPDLVVLDIRLPGMDGFEILARMKEDEATRDVPTVVLTGLGRESDVSRAFDLGADDYLVKPFSPVELTARALRLIRR